MKIPFRNFLATIFALTLSAVVGSAADSAAGNWKWSITTQNGDTFESTAKLKQDGDKLIGTVVRNENENQIMEGKVVGDEISFKVQRQRDGRTVTSKYKGKVSGDNLKGKVESDWSGDWQTIDWEGSRAK